MVQRGTLSIRGVEPDLLVAGRQHERFDQYFRGVRVYGGDITRQSADGATQSIFGTFYDGISISTTPTLSEEDARKAFSQLGGGDFPADRAVELVILPRDGGAFALA